MEIIEIEDEEKKKLNKKKIVIFSLIIILILAIISIIAVYISNKQFRDILDKYVLGKEITSENTREYTNRY